MKHSPWFAAVITVSLFNGCTKDGGSGRSSGAAQGHASLGAYSAATPTAYDALRAASALGGKNAQNRVVELSGKAGRPQPFVWKVTVADEGGRGGLQEVDVQRGKVVGHRRIPSAAGAVNLNLNAIQLDSDGVFSLANAEAVRAGVTYDRIDYTLSSTNQSGLPVWSVELFDGPSARTGALKILADNASIIERSPELALTEEEKRESRWSKPGEPYRSGSRFLPDFFHRQGVHAQEGLYKLKNWANGYGWTDDPKP
jgi:hypothetical protein